MSFYAITTTVSPDKPATCFNMGAALNIWRKTSYHDKDARILRVSPYQVMDITPWYPTREESEEPS